MNLHRARATRWHFNRVCFVAAVSPRTSELTNELGGKLVDRLSNFFFFFLPLDPEHRSTDARTGDTKKVDRRQRQSQSMDIKGITETSLMWFPSVAIRLPRYARYLQYGRVSVTEPRQQEGRESIRRALLCRPRYFLLSIKIHIYEPIVVFRKLEISSFQLRLLLTAPSRSLNGPLFISMTFPFTLFLDINSLYRYRRYYFSPDVPPIESFR